MSEQKIHSPIGASGMERWKNCPGSVRLSKGIVSVSSRYAEEGTEAHELGEAILIAKRDKKPDPDFFEYDEDMVDFVHVYVDHVLSLKRPGCIQLYEHKFHLKKIHPDLFGTADCVTYYPDKKLLIISDLKYGAGKFVDVTRNDQLMYYALGAVLTLGFAVHKVRIEIIQPRITMAEAIRPWECDLFEILEFAEELEMYAARTRAPDAPLAAGSWCKWCPAAAICPLLKEESRKLAKRVFSPQTKINYNELAETLDWLPVLQNYISSVREFAYNEAMRGVNIPRHKVVKKKPAKVWKNERTGVLEISKEIGLSTDKLFVTKRKMMTPSMMERIPLKDIKDRVKNKADLYKILVKHYELKSSGFALVHESDDRDVAPVVDPKSVFAPRGKNGAK